MGGSGPGGGGRQPLNTVGREKEEGVEETRQRVHGKKPQAVVESGDVSTGCDCGCGWCCSLDTTCASTNRSTSLPGYSGCINSAACKRPSFPPRCTRRAFRARASSAWTLRIRSASTMAGGAGAICTTRGAAGGREACNANAAMLAQVGLKTGVVGVYGRYRAAWVRRKAFKWAAARARVEGGKSGAAVGSAVWCGRKRRGGRATVRPQGDTERDGVDAREGVCEEGGVGV